MRQLGEGMGAATVRHAALACAMAWLAACGGDRDRDRSIGGDGAATGTATGTIARDSATAAPGTAARSRLSLADPDTPAQLDSVATAARSGLTSLAPAVAIPLLRSLEDKLDNSEDPALDDIADDLEDLREELADDTPDARDIAAILERLGPKVTRVAGRGGPAQATLTTIGSELSRAAAGLRAR